MKNTEKQLSEAAPAKHRTSQPPQPAGTEDVRASDVLVQAALDFLAELFPVANVHVTYTRKEEAPTAGAPGWLGADAPGPFQDIREVPTHPGYLRVVAIDVDRRISRFLGEDAEAHLETAYDWLAIPMELAHQWTRQVAGRASLEARNALRAQLPAHIIAHIIADYFAQVTGREAYRFERHGAPESAHDELVNTIVESLEYMDSLTRSRVEHQELSHGLVVAPLSAEGPGRAHRTLPQCCYPRDFRGLKRTPLLADGYQSALWITPDGQAAEMITRETLGDAHPLPDRDFGALSFIAAASKQHEGVGLILRPGGSIVTFASGQPLFIRRSSVWHGLIWNQVRNAMVMRYGEVGAQVFSVALILTTSGKGGILAIMDGLPADLDLSEKDRTDRARDQALEEPDIDGRLSQNRSVPAEWLFHRLLPAGNVTELSAPTLALLAGIDGATVVGEDGRLLSYGAIVPSVQSQSEGARTAAARTLSSHGLVIKVSEDGPVQLFEHGEAVLTV